MDWFVNLLVDIFYAGVIAVAAFFASAIIARRLRYLGKKYEELDETLFGFLASLARYAILAVAGIFILAQFGIQTTSLVALVGAAGLAIGLALQGTLSNLAAGVMLLIFRPFKVGDFIGAGGHQGTVKSITLFTVELATLDNLQIIVPNGDIWSSAITNFSVYDTRRADVVFGVSYDTDLKKVEDVLAEIVEAEERILDDPEPWIRVTNLNASSVDFTVRFWTARSDLAQTKVDLLRTVKDRFDAEGIDIPFPTVTQIQVAAQQM